MSELSKKAREAAKSKAQRLCEPTKGKVDASSWKELPNASMHEQTGKKVTTPRAFASGGKVGLDTDGSCGPRADRIARASGGRTKGKGTTNIVIAINPKGAGDGQQAAMGNGMPPRPPAPPIPVPAAPPAPAGLGAGAGPPMGVPPGMQMGRKTGGRVYRSYKDMDAGAGGAKGRLEKTEIQEHKK